MGDRLTASGERVFRLARWLLRGVALLVPGVRRDDWRAEWEGEVWHRLARTDPRTTWGALPGVAVRLAGAIPHAALLRVADWRLDLLRHDLRDAWRASWKRPAFSLTVIGTLALGIGANTALFTMVNSILLRPLPYERSEELVFAYGAFSGNQFAAISPPDFLDYREQNRVLRSFAARSFPSDLVLSGGGATPERADGVAVTANFFATLGVGPLHGRDFRPEEETAGSAVVLLSHVLWQRRHGSDPGVVGRSIDVNGRPHEVVGVMPPNADPTARVDLWLPVDLHSAGASIRRFHFLRGLGRLAKGVTLAEAQAQLDVIAARLEATYPENETWKLNLIPLRDEVVGDVGRTLVLLLGAVGLVLLIGCANLANLLLSRSTTRQGEIAIRTALGATRPRLVRQLLAESLFLAVAGGALGLGVALAAIWGLKLSAASALPRLSELAIDPVVLGFAAAVSVGTGLVFGLAPALQSAPASLTPALVSTRSSGSRRGQRARDSLVVLQVAVSLVLAIGAGLLVRSLWRLQAVDAGFDGRGVVVADVLLPSTDYPDTRARRRFWNDAVERLAKAPGVEIAAASRIVPLSGGGDTYYWIEGHEPTDQGERRNAQINSVSLGYFEAMGIPLVAGRAFDASERGGGPPALVINRGMAERLFPGESAVGQRLVVDFGEPYHAEIVGVVGDVLASGLRADAPDVVYVPADQHPAFGLSYVTLIARGERGVAGVGRAVRSVVAELDPNLPIGTVRTMDEVVDATTANDRLTAQVLTAFAAAALGLAMIGLYGVLSYAVSQRTREIGVRMALGAPRGAVFRGMVARGAAMLLVGIGVGIPIALIASRAIRSMLFQVGPADPLVFVSVTAALVAAGLAAAIVPARRATRVDPKVALQAEG
ncbi:MAG: ABC transporter permease [Gemmatimonadales bacterium]